MGCTNSKTAAAQLVDSAHESQTGPTLSIRSANLGAGDSGGSSPTARSARSVQPTVTGFTSGVSAAAAVAAASAPPALLPRAAAGDAAVAHALRTKQRHGAIVPALPAAGAAAEYQKRQVPKEAGVHAFLVQALQGNMFFGALNASELGDVVGAMECEHLATGELLMRQGEPGETMYAIESGRLEILMNGVRMAEYGEGTPGRIVGELAVLFSSPRSATVRAVTNCRLWRIDRAAYRAIVATGMEEEHATLLAALRRGILESLEEAQLNKLARAAFRVRFGPGEQIIRKGEVGEVLYIIEHGSVICRDLPGEQRDNILSAGDYFGERALFRKEQRPCNVYACSGGEAGGAAGSGSGGASLIALHRDDLESLLGQLRDLLEHNAGMRLLLCVPILSDLGEEDRGALFRSLRLLSYRPGQLLCAERMAVGQFWIIKEGLVEVRCAAGLPVDAPARAALSAKMARVAGRGGAAGAAGGAAAAAAAGAGERGSSGGEGGGALPVDESAKAASEAVAAAAAATGEFLGTLGSGQWFGDGEVKDNASSPFTYIATEPTQCFVLDGDAFRLYLAPIMNKWGASRPRPSSRLALAPEAEWTGIAGSSSSSSSSASSVSSSSVSVSSSSGGQWAAEEWVKPAAPRERLGLPFKELEQRTTLGTGTFGRVRIVYHRRSNRVFALKMLQKSQIVEYKQQANIINEKELLWRLDHPFIIRLYDTYKDRDRLYMLLEVVQGGELFARLQNSATPGRIPPSEARFYSSCVLDALDYLHSQAIVYRDLKPENLLIDSQGYLKMVDFGFAKTVKDRTYTVCGTPEYLSPELVLGKAHGPGVDYWALGILLFEQVAGYSPFCDAKGNDQMVICRNILKAEPEFPAHVKDKDCKDLILKLLTKDATKRLGCMVGGAAEVKAHPFFRHVDWKELRAKRLPVPWQPTLKSALDTSNFDPYDEEDTCEAYADDGTGWDASFSHL